VVEVVLVLAGEPLEQAVLVGVVTVKQMLELPHKTEPLTQVVEVEVLELQEVRFLAKLQVQAAPVLSSSKSHLHTMPHFLAVSHSHSAHLLRVTTSIR